MCRKMTRAEEDPEGVCSRIRKRNLASGVGAVSPATLTYHHQGRPPPRLSQDGLRSILHLAFVIHQCIDEDAELKDSPSIVI
jgi:hypothetical protein